MKLATLVLGQVSNKGKEQFKVMLVSETEVMVEILSGPRKGKTLTWKK